MSISDEYNNNSATLTLSTNFTFNDSALYREKLNKAIKSHVEILNINLSNLDFMDSSGLGMLMVTDNECKNNNINLQLYNPIGEVKKLLKITRCYERFHIIEH
jgi:anti-anti-sigma factor